MGDELKACPRCKTEMVDMDTWHVPKSALCDRLLLAAQREVIEADKKLKAEAAHMLRAANMFVRGEVSAVAMIAHSTGALDSAIADMISKLEGGNDE